MENRFIEFCNFITARDFANLVLSRAGAIQIPSEAGTGEGLATADRIAKDVIDVTFDSGQGMELVRLRPKRYPATFKGLWLWRNPDTQIRGWKLYYAEDSIAKTGTWRLIRDKEPRGKGLTYFRSIYTREARWDAMKKRGKRLTLLPFSL